MPKVGHLFFIIIRFYWLVLCLVWLRFLRCYTCHDDPRPFLLRKLIQLLQNLKNGTKLQKRDAKHWIFCWDFLDGFSVDLCLLIILTHEVKFYRLHQFLRLLQSLCMLWCVFQSASSTWHNIKLSIQISSAIFGCIPWVCNKVTLRITLVTLGSKKTWFSFFLWALVKLLVIYPTVCIGSLSM